MITMDLKDASVTFYDKGDVTFFSGDGNLTLSAQDFAKFMQLAVHIYHTSILGPSQSFGGVQPAAKKRGRPATKTATAKRGRPRKA